MYPVADVLRARDIPFVFVTGYGLESIDRRFVDIPVVEKPLDREALRGIFHARVSGNGADIGRRNVGVSRA